MMLVFIGSSQCRTYSGVVMTFEYMGAHPRTPPTKKRRYRRKDSSDPEEKLEDTAVVAELRLAVAKEEAESSTEEPAAG